MYRALLLALAACTGGTPSEDAAAKPPAGTTQSAAPATSGWDAPPDVVARVGGEPITAAELQELVAGEVVDLRGKLYEARKGALDQMIAERLVEAEAKKRNLTTDQLMQAEIEAKAPAPTPAEIEAFYNENAGRIRGSLEETVGPIAEHLVQQKQQELMQAFLASLREQAKVEILLDPPRFPVDPGQSPRTGTASAPVQIVEFSDFECPYCGIAAKTVHDVEAKYGDKVSISFVNFPLPMHANAKKAAEASLCANEQGKFWEYHDKLFANQKQLDPASLARYAIELGLDGRKFEVCLESGKMGATVEADLEKGRSVGMQGTPGFYVNGIHISGAVPIEAFSEVIDAELKRK